MARDNKIKEIISEVNKYYPKVKVENIPNASVERGLFKSNPFDVVYIKIVYEGVQDYRIYKISLRGDNWADHRDTMVKDLKRGSSYMTEEEKEKRLNEIYRDNEEYRKTGGTSEWA
jgi:hypothetical protein